MNWYTILIPSLAHIPVVWITRDWTSGTLHETLGSLAAPPFYAALRAFRARMAEVETTLQKFHTLLGELNTLWTAFDEAYKRSTKSQLTEEIARLDTERDHCAAVVKETAKLWATHFKDVDETLAIRGRRVLQPFIDFDFSTHESMVAENSKIENIEQVLSTAQLVADLQAMGLTAINQMLAVKTGQLIQLQHGVGGHREGRAAGGPRGALREVPGAYGVHQRHPRHPARGQPRRRRALLQLRPEED